MNPSKSAVDYWLAVNKTILGFSNSMQEIWSIEKIVAEESTKIAKEEGLRYLATERERIMGMSHEEALDELMRIIRIESKIKTIRKINDNGLFAIQ